jgi:hypothetical protein
MTVRGALTVEAAEVCDASGSSYPPTAGRRLREEGT